MKKVKVEIKTIYSIRVTVEDLVNVLKSKPVVGFEEFRGRDIEEVTMKELRNKMEFLGMPSILLTVPESKQQKVEVDELVRKLGFDGCSFYGMYDDKKFELHLEVYNYGADKF